MRMNYVKPPIELSEQLLADSPVKMLLERCCKKGCFQLKAARIGSIRQVDQHVMTRIHEIKKVRLTSDAERDVWRALMAFIQDDIWTLV